MLLTPFSSTYPHLLNLNQGWEAWPFISLVSSRCFFHLTPQVPTTAQLLPLPFSIRLLLSQWKHLPRPPPPPPRGTVSWTARKWLLHPSSSHTLLPHYLPPPCWNYSIPWCLLALFVSCFFFIFSLLPISGAFLPKLLVVAKNDSEQGCLRACWSVHAHAYGQQSLAVSWGRLQAPPPTQVPPPRHSWDWVHYSVGVGSSCEWREMASCSVCVVAPPTLLSMGNHHKILQIRDFNCQTEMDTQPEEWLMVKGECFPGEGLILDDWMCLFVLFES